MCSGFNEHVLYQVLKYEYYIARVYDAGGTCLVSTRDCCSQGDHAGNVFYHLGLQPTSIASNIQPFQWGKNRTPVLFKQRGATKKLQFASKLLEHFQHFNKIDP